MFTAKIEVKGLKEVENYFKAALDRLIDPSYELAIVAEFVEREILNRRFNEEKNPAGGRWKPSQRALKDGGKTLTDKRDMRRRMRAFGRIIKSGLININMDATGKLNRIKAHVHNNGLRINNRAGRKTAMPKRQFAWLSKKEKEQIIYDIFLRGLD